MDTVAKNEDPGEMRQLGISSGSALFAIFACF